MKTRPWFFICLLVLALGTTPLYGQQSFLLKNDIIVESGETQENVFTIGGSIHIKGKVNETAAAIGGTIIIEGEVGETVLGIGCDIILKPSARVRGDVVSLGGTLEKMAGTVIEGDTIYFKTDEGLRQIVQEGLLGRTGISLLPLLVIFRLIMAFIWFILAIILLAIFPRQIPYASSQLRENFWPVFGTGALSIIIFTGLVVFSALLSLALIGLPILLSLIIIGIIIKIFGQVVLFYFFGESIHKVISQKQVQPLLAITLGFILITLIGLIPVFGALFSLFLSIIGWGVVLRTKFGTTSNWFKKSV
jgi:hypothetical protein